MATPLPRALTIAATRKSSGKTTLSIGLTRALTRRGLSVQTFKKGPDYIDPLWLTLASGRPCYNLDFNTQTEAEIKALFAEKSAGADFVIVETNKGLFDGLDVKGSDSNAALVKLLGTPVVLVIDTVGMTRGIAPLLLGYQQFDTGFALAGVILNKTGGPRHLGKLKAAIELYNGLEVLGALGRDDRFSIDERHLGLTTPGDQETANEVVDALADMVEAGVDLDNLLGRAEPPDFVQPGPVEPVSGHAGKVTIAIARDRAFGFYYPDDLEALERAGANLVFFDALNDAALPPADGLFIGGGFPETSLSALSANSALRHDIRTRIEAGMPTYAECGGLMYLCERLEWGGESGEMVGVVPGTAVMNERPQGRGFARLKATRHAPFVTGTVAVHEFHYASIRGLPEGMVYAYEVERGHGIDGKNDGIVVHNTLANFCHFRHTEACRWAQGFVNFVREKS